MNESVLLSLAAARTPRDEAALERWYRDVHLPQVLAGAPALESAALYRAAAHQTDERWLPPQRLLTVYRLADVPDAARLAAHQLAELAGSGTLDFTRDLDVRSVRQAIFERV